MRASNTEYNNDEDIVKIDTVPDTLVKIDTVPDSIVKTDTVPISTWDLQDAKCILSMKSDCSIDVKGFRFFTMERLFYALQLLSLGDRKFIRQLAKYSRMDYVRKCVNTRVELASTTLQNKWLDEQFQTWTQIITARILSDSVFKQALLDSAGSPLCDPDEPVYVTARRMALRSHPVTEEVTPPMTPPRAQAMDENTVAETPSPVQKPGRSRGRGTWRAPQKVAPGVGTRSRTRLAEIEKLEATHIEIKIHSILVYCITILRLYRPQPREAKQASIRNSGLIMSYNCLANAY